MDEPTSENNPVYRADCPSRVILDQIADKWSMMVLAGCCHVNWAAVACLTVWA